MNDLDDNVVIFPDDQNMKYNFDFMISVEAGKAKTSLSVPSQFNGMTDENVLMITQLSLSLFESTPVFERSNNRHGGLNFVPDSFSNKTLRLVLDFNSDTGYSLYVEVPKELQNIVGQELIAEALHVEFEKYEAHLMNAPNSIDDEYSKSNGALS